MNTDKLAFNWQNFARVRLQLKFAFIIRHFILNLQIKVCLYFILLFKKIVLFCVKKGDVIIAA